MNCETQNERQNESGCKVTFQNGDESVFSDQIKSAPYHILLRRPTLKKRRSSSLKDAIQNDIHPEESENCKLSRERSHTYDPQRSSGTQSGLLTSGGVNDQGTDESIPIGGTGPSVNQMQRRRTSSQSSGSQRERLNSLGSGRYPSARGRSDSTSSNSSPSKGAYQRDNPKSTQKSLSSSWSSGFFSPRGNQIRTKTNEGKLEMSQHCSLRSLDSQISCARSSLHRNEQNMSQLRIERRYLDIVIRVVVDWINMVKSVNRLSKAVPDKASVRKASTEMLAQLHNEKSLFNSNFLPLVKAYVPNGPKLSKEVHKLKVNLKNSLEDTEHVTAKHVEDTRFILGYLKGTFMAIRDILY